MATLRTASPNYMVIGRTRVFNEVMGLMGGRLSQHAESVLVLSSSLFENHTF